MKWENIFKTICGIGGALASYLFGGWSAVLGVLLAFVVAGVIAGAVEGKLSSQIGMKGIAKKVMIFLIVAVAHLADTAVGMGNIFRDAAIFFYIANELLSILENAGRIGVPIPSAIQKAVEILNGKSNIDKGESSNV
jgi:toxin secretion/phage lysis holin